MTGQMSLFQDPKKEDRLTIMEAARLLGVSRATAGNWQKAGRLKPCYEEEGRQYFSRQELLALLERIKNGQEGLLRQRRNKTQISGHLLQQDYAGESCTLKTVTGILDRLRSLETELAEPLDPALTLRLLLAEYALKQLALSGLLSREEPRQGGVSGPLWERSLLEEYLKGRLEAGVYEPLIRSLLEQAVPLEEAALLALRPAFTVPVEWGKEDDLLGLLYLALNPLNRRKREGAFYTPAALTREMADSLWRQGLLEPCRRIWDPACGCGNFLLAVYHRTGSLEGLYGSDIDPLAVTLSRLNLILASKARDIRGILERVRQEDSLYRIEASFDLVLANPPWGQRLSGRQQSFLRRVYATGAGRRQIESFDVFGELALRTCRPGGTVALVLPEAFLQAEAHACLRRLFREESQLKRLHLWGNIFQGIQCPALTIEAKRAPGGLYLRRSGDRQGGEALRN